MTWSRLLENKLELDSLFWLLPRPGWTVPGCGESAYHSQFDTPKQDVQHQTKKNLVLEGRRISLQLKRLGRLPAPRSKQSKQFGNT